MKDQHLPADLVWRDDGHLHEATVTALSDTQYAVVPPDAATHADACDACAERVGAAALLSLSVGQALEGTALVPALATARRPLPRAALATALLLAAAGALPSLWQAPARLAALPRTLMDATPVLVASLHAVLRGLSSHSAWLSFATVFAAALMLLVGFSIARQAPRELSWKGVGR